MPRVLPRPKFRDDEIVRACDPFSGSLDGVPFVANPSTPFRGDDPIVRAYPWMFYREGHYEERAAYFAALEAERQAEREREQAVEGKRREKDRAKAMKLADQLEREERKRREREREESAAWWQGEDARKRGRVSEEERQAEERRIRMLAEVEVARRLGDAA